MFRRILYHPFFIRLFHWEYWPFNAVYGPVLPYWLWLCVRARSFFFFNTSNPTIKNGGFLLESKKEIYDIIPREFYPGTLFFKAGIKHAELLKALEKSALQLPLIAKPDIGGKGRGVKKFNTTYEIVEYAKESKVDFLLQEFVPYKNEAGIFYCRFPDQPKGFISGIVAKEFLKVKGDGNSTIEELLQKEKRFILQLPSLRNLYKEKLQEVLKKDEDHLLVPYGNHARGAKFIDAHYMINERLSDTIDTIAKQIPGFYFGRLDIRFNTWQQLSEGKDFSIIELNGAGSEPTHIYDPAHSIFFAWKEIIRHWNILYKISRLNHNFHKLPYMKFGPGI
ncbi:MAG TPA: hypothetical protein VH396_02960, partial [Chitinophagaceae bacterium]